jgi:hypothetical protein
MPEEPPVITIVFWVVLRVLNVEGSGWKSAMVVGDYEDCDVMEVAALCGRWSKVAGERLCCFVAQLGNG